MYCFYLIFIHFISFYFILIYYVSFLSFFCKLWYTLSRASLFNTRALLSFCPVNFSRRLILFIVFSRLFFLNNSLNSYFSFPKLLILVINGFIGQMRAASAQNLLLFLFYFFCLMYTIGGL